MVLEAEGKQRQAQIQKLDQQMRSRIVSLKEEHDGALRGAEEYYSVVQRKLLEDQKLLKVRRSNSSTHHLSSTFKGASQASAPSKDLGVVSCEGTFLSDGCLLWQRELAEATKVQAQALRELSAAQQEKQRLQEAVREAELKLLGAREQLERSRKEKARMKVRELHTCWRRCFSPLVNTHLKAPRSRRRCRPNR